MLIQSILIREGGSHVELDGVTYHFAPIPTGEHVAEVESDDHIDRLLAIPEGFRVFRRAKEDAPPLSGGAAGAAGGSAGASALGGTGTPATDDGGDNQAGDEPPDLEAMSRDDLVALYENLAGTKPHHMIGEPKLRKLVADLLARD